jgi:hypothetical protein
MNSKRIVITLVSTALLSGTLLAAPAIAITPERADLTFSATKSFIPAKKRLTKKKARAIYIDAVCTPNRVNDAWTAYDADGNFDASLLYDSASNSIAAADYAAAKLSGKSWPKNIKKKWINTMRNNYKEDSWQLSRYLSVTSEAEYVDANNRYYNEFSNAATSATDKIRKKLGLPPAPAGC